MNDVEIMEKIDLAESARQAGNENLAIKLLIETLRAIVAKETKMKRPELTYCNICGGVILPVDTAWPETDGTWECDICHVGIEQDAADAVALERGTYRMPRDPRDEMDGGER